jgi:hypothetical protein
MSQIYQEYWKRKQTLKSKIPHFPVVRWYDCPELSPIEEIYFNHIRNCSSILDFGAGDLRTKNKFVAAGFKGQYDTLDIAGGFEYTYHDITQVKKTYDAILCLDVIEHVPLETGLGLLQSFASLLNPGGTLIVQTPNARCIRHPLSWDMTHVQCYNAPDLWTYISSQQLEVTGMRVAFGPKKYSFLGRIKYFFAKVITTQFLGMDYADNIAMIAKKK